ncbi:RDD family protein [Halopseudomonas salegens]|uniref:RDD family protein n=1 Tax=Halopseudomonas salegens TaxID=1434072 RepID=A0A1H2E9R4_9GAMM|nr:RDD family protein [Halopseudomonas salegens]SDT91872.1 RDD family protein [Halopseudomonas salegens]
MTVKQLQPSGEFPATTLTRRFGVLLYDWLLGIALVMCLTLFYQQVILRQIYGGERLRALSEAGALDRDPLLAVIVLLSLFGYLAWMWTLKGQTLGMQAWRVRAQQLNGNSITWKQALLRFVVGFFALACGGLGLWWMLFDKQSRTWQDIASNTQLVTLPKDLWR